MIQLLEGDGVAGMSFLPDPVDCVITDPPYSERVHSKGRAGSSGEGEISRTRDLGFEHLTRQTQVESARMFAKLAKRWILIFSDVEGIDSWRRAFELIGGVEYVRTCFWVKRGAAPQFTGDRPASHVEAIVCFHRAHDDGRNRKKRWNGGGRGNVFTYPVSHSRVRVHPTQKPLALMKELVELFSDAGETVLDPFAGSGTTAVACKQLGRRCVAFERDPDHFAAMELRVANTYTPRAVRAQQEDNAETSD